MPTTFRDREMAFEAKFAHDEEFRFLATARRDKLFAGWATTRLRLAADKAEALVKALLAIPGGPAHDQAVLQHMAGVFARRGDALPHEILAAELERCAEQARRELIALPLTHHENSLRAPTTPPL